MDLRRKMSVFAAVFGLLTIPACEQNRIEPPKPLEPLVSDKSPVEKPVATVLAQADTWISPEELPQEYWYVQYLGGKRVGYSHTTLTNGSTTQLVRINQEGAFELPGPDGSTQLYTITLESLEYPDGNLASFTETTSAGNSSIEITGKLQGNRVSMVTKNSEGTKKSSMVWPDGTWGVLGVQAMMLKSPMTPGERRKCSIFVPKLKKAVDVEMLAGQPEITALPGGATPELVPVEALMTSGETGTRSRNWIDESGNILKTVTFGEAMVSTFRAPEDIAKRIADEMKLSAQLENSVSFSGDLPKAADVQAVYRTKGSNIDLFSIWAKDQRQSVKSISALSAEVRIDSAGNGARPEQLDAARSAAYLDSSSLVQHEHPTVAALAADLLPPERQDDSQTPAEQARVLVKNFAEVIQEVPFSSDIAGALATARQRKGDVVEQSILLVALLRNRGIPARAASGLRIDRPTKSMKFAMWVEAWGGSNWVSFDPLTGGEIGVDSLKMLDSDLSEPTPYAPILTVYERMDFISVNLLGSR